MSSGSYRVFAVDTTISSGTYYMRVKRMVMHLEVAMLNPTTPLQVIGRRGGG